MIRIYIKLLCLPNLCNGQYFARRYHQVRRADRVCYGYVKQLQPPIRETHLQVSPPSRAIKRDSRQHKVTRYLLLKLDRPHGLNYRPQCHYDNCVDVLCSVAVRTTKQVRSLLRNNRALATNRAL